MLAILHHTGRPQHLAKLLPLIAWPWNEPKVIVATDDIVEPGWDVMVSDWGQTWALWDTFKRFMQTDNWQLTVLEDDVIPCKNAFEYMLWMLTTTNKYNWFSWYNVETLYIVGDQRVETRTARYEFAPGLKKRFHGCSAFTINRDAVKRLLQYDVDWYIKNYNRPNAGDLAMTEAWPDARVGWHIPSLFRHEGIVSSWYPKPRTGEGFDTPTYPGDDFDAMSLLR